MNASRYSSRQEFMDRFGGLYEHSPWVAERVYEKLQGDFNNREELEHAFRDTVLSASLERQLDLLNAHPELACAEADRESLTEESSLEQHGAGLDCCSAEEYGEFTRLNRQYRDTFGFPFILAVRGYERAEILDIFRERVNCDADSEFNEALGQVCRIARFRLEALFRGRE